MSTPAIYITYTVSDGEAKGVGYKSMSGELFALRKKWETVGENCE